LTVNPTPAIPVIVATSNQLVSSSPTGNRWFYNGTPINGATAQICSPIASGLYTVQVTVGNCKATSNPYNFVFTRIDAPSAWNGEVVLYPNPVANKLMIKNPAVRKLNLQFYDVNGKKVYESTLQTSQGQIDLQGLAGGIYQVVITDVKRNESVLQTIVKL
ncbi:MAG TPA: T9SS type A sorting domain-containing protein, partial [Flavisolibacter sp.]|nr:T9SS type A sorting domain-containing protein [Flavisolibacter sp.]